MLYMIVDKAWHDVKVGYTNNIINRMKKHYHPDHPRAELIATVETGNLFTDLALERACHKEMQNMKYVSRVSNTEWYHMGEKNYNRFIEKKFDNLKCAKGL